MLVVVYVLACVVCVQEYLEHSLGGIHWDIFWEGKHTLVSVPQIKPLMSMCMCTCVRAANEQALPYEVVLTTCE